MEPSELSQPKVLELAGSDDPSDRLAVENYIQRIAQAFTGSEAFAVMALVDTPDVFD
jgi:DNA-binding transcriptional regulator LsrR (DeoR family)